jgi:DNA-binding SARP family transcriptional activator
MRGNTFAVRLIGRFSLSRGPSPVTLSAGSARVVAFLALHRPQQHRSHVAGQLWPELSEARARANLRNALWRTQPLGEDLLICEADTIGLAPDVDVDVDAVRASAEALVGDTNPSPPFPRAESFGQELLADWSEDWVLFERERLNQLCVHALEALSTHCLRGGHYAKAIDSALLAVKREPLRESAHRAVSRAHLAEGNLASARLQFQRYAAHVRTELGIEPSDEFIDLVARPEPMRRFA